MIATVKSFLTAHALRILAVVLAAVALFAVIQTIRIEGVWCNDDPDKPSCIIRGFKQELQITRISLAEAEANHRAEVAKHKATKQAYRDAQEEAARMQAEAIERVVAKQEKITDAVRQDYQQRIAALRARADRLRAQAEAAAGGTSAAGAPDHVRLPQDGSAARGIDDPARCQEIPARDIETEITCREIAEAQATQLEALIAWVEKQLGVRP